MATHAHPDRPDAGPQSLSGFGHYGDEIGREQMLVVTILIVGPQPGL